MTAIPQPLSSGIRTVYAMDDMMGDALARIGVRADQVNADHIVESTRSANLMLASWAADGFRQFDLKLVTLAVGPGGVDVAGNIAASNFPAGTMQIFSGVITVSSTFDVPMVRIAIYDYEQLPFKSMAGRPDRFVWYGVGNQLSARNLQLWPIPNVPYNLRFWCITRSEDVGTLVNSPDIGYEWQDAFAAGLAARLARKYNPQLVQELKLEAGGPDMPINAATGYMGGAYLVAKRGERERGPTRMRVDYRTRESPR